MSITSEKEGLDLASSLMVTYKKLHTDMRKEYDELEKLKSSFPIKYIENDNFEDLLLQASNAKFKAIILVRKLNGLAAEITYELEYLVSNFKLNIADDALSEKFDKITEGLRDAYVNSKKELKELVVLKEKVEILADSSEKMVKMFDSDEINFRRIAEKKNRLMGFS